MPNYALDIEESKLYKPTQYCSALHDLFSVFVDWSYEYSSDYLLVLLGHPLMRWALDTWRDRSYKLPLH